jgi:hypothetical protein
MLKRRGVTVCLCCSGRADGQSKKAKKRVKPRLSAKPDRHETQYEFLSLFDKLGNLIFFVSWWETIWMCLGLCDSSCLNEDQRRIQPTDSAD